MIVFAVSQLRSYYNCGERSFGTDNIFLTYDEAKEFIKQEIDDIISGTMTSLIVITAESGLRTSSFMRKSSATIVSLRVRSVTAISSTA